MAGLVLSEWQCPNQVQEQWVLRHFVCVRLDFSLHCHPGQRPASSGTVRTTWSRGPEVGLSPRCLCPARAAWGEAKVPGWQQ